jgi:organic hydroperoxide reductase OsmC/OhrA
MKIKLLNPAQRKRAKRYGGSFKEITLNPIFYVADDSMVEKAIELHHKAHELCYIANSVNFEVKFNPTCKVE